MEHLASQTQTDNKSWKNRMKHSHTVTLNLHTHATNQSHSRPTCGSVLPPFYSYIFDGWLVFCETHPLCFVRQDTFTQWSVGRSVRLSGTAMSRNADDWGGMWHCSTELENWSNSEEKEYFCWQMLVETEKLGEGVRRQANRRKNTPPTHCVAVTETVSEID